MNLEEFINTHDVDYSYNRVNDSFLTDMEKYLGLKIGNQLKTYIISYGYLGYEYIELFGVNSIQGLDSDLIKHTLFLHQQFESTKGLIAIEDQGDGDYYLVDENDDVYHLLYDKSIVKTDLDLYGYILKRFTTVIT